MKRVFLLFAVTRVVLFLVAAAPPLVAPCERFRVAVDGPPGVFEEQIVPWSKSDTGERYNLTQIRWLDAFTHMDARYYLSIGAFSYRLGEDGAIPKEAGFFPGYPLAVRVVARGLEIVSGVAHRPDPVRRTLWLVAALLVAQGALLLAALSLQRLAASIAGEDVGVAAAAVLLLNPFAFFGSAMLSESLFLFLSIECLRRAHRREFAWAAVFGAAAALTRPIGAALVVPLLAASFERRSDRRETIGDACAFALVPAGAALVPAWHGIALGAPFAYAEIQRQYGHGAFPDFRGVVELLGIFGPTPLDTARNVIQVAGLVAAAASLFALRHRAREGRFPWFLVVWGATALAVPLLSGHVISLPRYVFGAFPVFIGAVYLLPRSRGALVTVGVVAMILQIAAFMVFAKAWPLFI